jgi:electron transfer flavoprotein-quinone oxidoreductase
LSSEKFDAIIVGGGPAGLSAAYFLAKSGYQVLLLEKGKTLGSKNLYGGKVYAKIFKDLFPGFEKEAPIHRWVSKEIFSILSGSESTSLIYDTKEYSAFTSNLTELCSWLGKKAEEAGATIFTEMKVSSLLKEGDKIIGVNVGGEKVEADVVIVAEGANRLLSEKSGLVNETPKHVVALGFKESVKIGTKEIQERLNLEENEGASWMFIGDFTNGIPDGGFLYTFRDYVSIGIVLSLEEAVHSSKEHVSIMLERLRNHPVVKNLLKGGETIEYGAHLTIVDPISYMPRTLSGKGYAIIGDAAGLLGNLGYTFRGVDFAAYSGYIAANSFDKMRNGEWESYDEQIKNSWVYNEVKRFSNVHEIMKKERLLNTYPAMLNEIMASIFHIEENTPKMGDAALKSMKKWRISPLHLMSDLIRLAREM